MSAPLKLVPASRRPGMGCHIAGRAVCPHSAQTKARDTGFRAHPYDRRNCKAALADAGIEKIRRG
jgi:hypothetical protein